MNFTRTNRGLSNARLFLDVDAVVYLEGGDAEVDGGISYNSDDIRFWQSIFEKFCGNRSFEFRSLGSKSAVRDYAKKISDGEITGSIALMDRDFENLNGELLVSPNVIYTMGYSWENDAWSADSVYEACLSVLGMSRHCSSELYESIEDLFSEIIGALRRFVRIDAGLGFHGCSFFDRKRFERYLNNKVSNRPKLNKSELRVRLNSIRAESGRFNFHGLSVDGRRDCYGHLYESIAYRVFCFVLNSYGGKSLTKAHARSIVIDRLLLRLDDSCFDEVRGYYSSKISGVLC